MNRKEIAEIRRRLNPDHASVTRIRGCYVNSKREIISTFNQSPQMMPEEELEKYLALFKRVLSGTPDRNLIDIGFSAEQVREDEHHALLMTLRDTALEDDEPVQAFFQKLIDALALEDNYLILLMHDAYDVPSFASDDEKIEDGTEIFHYMLCAVCPVRLSKPALRYCAPDNEFHTRQLDWIVNAPELGFMFPVFDERTSNIYGALYYTRDAAQPHDELIDAAFGAEQPMPAEEQKETFQAILTDALAEDCSYDVVQTVHEQISERIKEQKSNKEAEPVRISRNEMKDMLRAGGVSEERVEAFQAQYDEKFGAGVDVSAVNLVEPRKLSLRTPNVAIQVDPDRGDLIETRVINGTKYILIRADEGVEVNGVAISITSESDCPF